METYVLPFLPTIYLCYHGDGMSDMAAMVKADILSIE